MIKHSFLNINIKTHSSTFPSFVQIPSSFSSPKFFFIYLLFQLVFMLFHFNFIIFPSIPNFFKFP